MCCTCGLLMLSGGMLHWGQELDQTVVFAVLKWYIAAAPHRMT